MSACSHRCGGVCCQRFPISMPPEEMAERYREIVAWRDAGNVLDRWMQDLVTIVEMIIQLKPAEGEDRPMYTCRHLDRTSGLCTIYDRRPRMCSDYPGYERGGSCSHCGFTQQPDASVHELKSLPILSTTLPANA